MKKAGAVQAAPAGKRPESYAPQVQSPEVVAVEDQDTFEMPEEEDEENEIILESDDNGDEEEEDEASEKVPAPPNNIIDQSGHDEFKNQMVMPPPVRPSVIAKATSSTPNGTSFPPRPLNAKVSSASVSVQSAAKQTTSVPPTKHPSSAMLIDDSNSLVRNAVGQDAFTNMIKNILHNSNSTDSDALTEYLVKLAQCICEKLKTAGLRFVPEDAQDMGIKHVAHVLSSWSHHTFNSEFHRNTESSMLLYDLFFSKRSISSSTSSMQESQKIHLLFWQSATALSLLLFALIAPAISAERKAYMILFNQFNNVTHRAVRSLSSFDFGKCATQLTLVSFIGLPTIALLAPYEDASVLFAQMPSSFQKLKVSKSKSQKKVCLLRTVHAESPSTVDVQRALRFGKTDKVKAILDELNSKPYDASLSMSILSHQLIPFDKDVNIQDENQVGPEDFALYDEVTSLCFWPMTLTPMMGSLAADRSLFDERTRIFVDDAKRSTDSSHCRSIILQAESTTSIDLPISSLLYLD